MSALFDRIRTLVAAGDRRYSAHAVREIAADAILIRPLVESIASATVVEEYPDYHKGPCVLILQHDEAGRPVHLLWGIPKDSSGPATLVTAYRPKPSQWETDFVRRRPR